jgi:hypothetical protein
LNESDCFQENRIEPGTDFPAQIHQRDLIETLATDVRVVDNADRPIVFEGDVERVEVATASPEEHLPVAVGRNVSDPLELHLGDTTQCVSQERIVEATFDGHHPHSLVCP